MKDKLKQLFNVIIFEKIKASQMIEPGKYKAQIILEYIKVFIWPVLISVAVISYHDSVFDILKTRKWRVGIVEVGERVESFEKAILDQLTYQKDSILLIKENADNQAKVIEYADKLLTSLKNAQIGVKQEAKSISVNIQQPVDQKKILRSDKIVAGNIQISPSTALGWEEQGFHYLLTKNLDDALHAFTKAETIWPDFHNVSEIRSLLAKQKNFTGNGASVNWKSLYEIILNDYSWGMPSDVRRTIQLYIEKGN